MTNILEKIIEEKKYSLDLIKKEKSLDILEKNIKEQSFLNFKETIQKNQSVSLITEIKKASPSAGVLINNFDHLNIAKMYVNNGATCLSVLTEEKHFLGKLDYIQDIKKKIKVPIILLTAKGEASERVEGLETGADDYLPKPFEPKELLLRINNILKKTKKVNLKHVLEFGSIKIDLNKLMITNQNSNYKINNTEKTILEKMINNPGKVFSRIDIGNLIKIDKERSIDVIITRLRKKIETNPKNPKYLQTIRGSGYVLWVE